MGHGDKEMGTPKTSKHSKDTRHPSSTVNSAKEFFERVRRKSRELDLATGTVRKIRQFGD